MTPPQGTDLWLRLGFGFVAIVFVLSLPAWALGAILVVGLVARVGIDHVREELSDEQPSRSTHEGEKHG